jgi:tRNA dimethylallyltransferase
MCGMAGQWQEPAGPARLAVIVAGPTASGKSALALELARRLGGTVINADSMQVYRELRVVTARPSAADEALAPHALYGVRAAAEPGSVAWWRDAALAAMDAAAVPILCGGTGLYLQSLTAGLADIPDPGVAARAEARSLLDEIGSVALHARLADVDPATAATLRPSDGQRIARAWEVWRGTGRGMTAWYAATPVPAGWRYAAVVLDPPRDGLREAIAARFTGMVEQGAVEEVAALLALDLDPALPAMRALGVPELAAYLRGEIGIDDAVQRAALASGRYTKRQATWFRHHALAAPAFTHTIHARYAGVEQYYESLEASLRLFLQSDG